MTIGYVYRFRLEGRNDIEKESLPDYNGGVTKPSPEVIESFGSVAAIPSPGVFGKNILRVMGSANISLNNFDMHAIDGVYVFTRGSFPRDHFGWPDAIDPPNHDWIAISDFG